MVYWYVRCYCVVFVFFFKQKTAYEMRISDWSSDVCSSDLGSMRPGDLALYRGDSGHINIVTDPKNRETVGGNESNNRVKRTTGYVNSASSIRRPKFARGGVLDARTVRLAGGLDELRNIAWQDRVESPDVTPETARRRSLFAAPPWVSRDMGGLLPDGVAAVNTSGTAEVVSTLDQLKALEIGRAHV